MCMEIHSTFWCGNQKVTPPLFNNVNTSIASQKGKNTQISLLKNVKTNIAPMLKENECIITAFRPSLLSTRQLLFPPHCFNFSTFPDQPISLKHLFHYFCTAFSNKSISLQNSFLTTSALPSQTSISTY
jgi:hypothetical protein